MAVSVPSPPDRLHPRICLSHEWPLPRSTAVDARTVKATTFSCYAGFIVSRQYSRAWLQIWRQLAVLARAAPGCGHFQLMTDCSDDMYFAIYSEWTDLEAYENFERQAQVKSTEEKLLSMSFTRDGRCLAIVPVKGFEMLHNA